MQHRPGGTFTPTDRAPPLANDARSREVQAEGAALRQRHASMTPREREVLDGLVAGKLNKQIAAELGIVEPTVKFHCARIMERMQAHNIAELMHLLARLEVAQDTRPAPPPGDAVHGTPT